MRTYISPIGYNPTSVTRALLLSRGLETDDTVVLLRPENETDDTRAQETITDVKRFLREIEPEVSMTIERIPYDDFPQAVHQCSDIIQAAEGTVIPNLSGGARDIYLPFSVAVLTHAPLIDTALAFSDIDGKVREWELPVLTADIPNSTRETLRRIAAVDDGITIPELTDQTHQAKSTVTRHVNQLAAADVVTTWQDGKTKYTQISLTGQLLLATDQYDHADQ